MMALNPIIAVDSFFNEQGCPYTMQEICAAALKELQNARWGDENIYKSNVRKYLEHLWTMPFSERFMRALKVYSISNLVNIVKDDYDGPYSMNTMKTYVKGEIAYTAIAILGMATLDHTYKRDKKYLTDQIARNIGAWEMKKNATLEFPERLHQQIQQGCSDLDSNSIRDIRVWVVTHHPTATARVLIHPSGRLFTEREICIALKIFGKYVYKRPSPLKE